uniref:Uncharacterized protein n=1 Tax=Panagrolaimus davidi TaxID=227884 RepID=A0A914QIM7_9BILA
MLSFYSLMTVILNLFILKAVCSSNDPINSKYEIGTEIVTASIRKIQDSCIFNNDLLFMHRIAFHETTDGNDLMNIWNTEKGRSGIWQNNASVLEILQNSTNSLTENQRIAVSEELQINITDFNWESGDLEIPLNSAAVARMFISTFENSLIPFDLAGQARFWVSL